MEYESIYIYIYILSLLLYGGIKFPHIEEKLGRWTEPYASDDPPVQIQVPFAHYSEGHPTDRRQDIKRMNGPGLLNFITKLGIINQEKHTWLVVGPPL